MLSILLESLFSRLDVGLVTDFFILILVSLFFIAVLYKRSNKHQQFTHFAPTLLTTLGILGTFFGIVIGLLGFDITNIDGSIEALLGGMKTAFITSLVGMLLAVIYKTLVTTEVLSIADTDEVDADQIGPAELYRVMQEQRDGILSLEKAIGSGEESSLTGQMKLLRNETSDAQKAHAQSLDRLNQSIGGDHESSLTGQVKLLRTEANDAQKAHTQSLDQLNQSISGDDELSLAGQMKSLLSATMDAHKAQVESFQELNQSIGADNESSLTGQIKLLRTDINDTQQQARQEFLEFKEKLWAQLHDFSETLSKSATEAVIQALNQIITDFNNNMTEQFGDNFKELNKAVEKLVLWQENYKGQVEEMTRQYAQGVTAIAETEKAVAGIQEQTLKIPDSMGKLNDVIQVNQHQIGELARHLEAFKEVREKAVDALPQLREQINKTLASVDGASTSLLEGLGKSSELMQASIASSSSALQEGAQEANRALVSASEIVQKSSESTVTQLQTLSSEMSEHSRQVSETLRDSGKALEEEAARSRKQFEAGLETMRDQLNSSLEMMAEQQASKVQGLITGLKESMEESIRKSAQSVEGSVEIIDQALQAEINRTMEQMGAALVSITGKFTEDYQALVNQMQRVTRTQPEL